MLIIPLMSCSGRMPVYILLAGAFFPKKAGLVMLGLYALGILLAMIAAKIQDGDKAAKLVDLVMTREYRPEEKNQDQAKLAAAIEKNIMKFAEEVGLDTAKLKEDMQGEIVARELAQVRDLAQRFEISGTPFLIIGEEAFPGALPAEQIKAALDK